MQRSIWIEEEDWGAIREWAKKEDRTISRYLVHLHRDYVNFIEHENLRVVQKVVPEIIPGPDRHVILKKDAVAHVEIRSKESEKSDIIKQARGKIDDMINKPDRSWDNSAPNPKAGKK